MAQTEQLADTLSRALTASRPLTMQDRRERDDQVWIVLNPGSHTNIGNERYEPGSAVLVDERQAERLTTPRNGRAIAAARYLDDPEPDTRGDFPQPHGPGMFHPDSKKAKKAKEAPLRAGPNQKLVDGELVETGVPSEKERTRGDDEDDADRDEDQSSSRSTSLTSGGTSRQGGSDSGNQGGTSGGNRSRTRQGNPGGQATGAGGGSAAAQNPQSTPTPPSGDGSGSRS